ncbi:MAG: hypothetical protein M3Q14_00300 [bacterium]|nr:hypothetical protein [bacterium]
MARMYTRPNMETDENNPDLPCSDKLAFDDKPSAEGAATTIAYQRGSSLKPYQCRHCELWHLASYYERER